MTNIVESMNNRYLRERREYSLFNRISVIIKDSIIGEIDVVGVISEVEGILSDKMMSEVEIIYIGEFDVLDRREVEAIYLDGAIYITNEIKSGEEMLDVIIHEVAHSLEENNQGVIYSDGNVRGEYLGKKKRLFGILGSEGYRVADYDDEGVEYDEGFDRFLYETVGYPMLTTLTMGLFISPYAITSLREYFANAFEEYYVGDEVYVKKICPVVVEKIEQLEEVE